MARRRKVARSAAAPNDRWVETSVHRELKRIYAGDDGALEVRRGPYRIDAVRGELLIEIQHSGLAQIRDKVRALLAECPVLLVVPIVASKRIEWLAGKDGPPTRARRSPKRGTALDLFDELVYFKGVFPHQRLVIETPMIEIAELRYKGHGRRRRQRETDFVVADQRLLSIERTHRYRSAADLCAVLPDALGDAFDTAELASALGVGRRAAQRIAYCLRAAGATTSAGKRGNALLYARSLQRADIVSERR